MSIEIREITDWRDENQVTRDDFIHLSSSIGDSGNIYVKDWGYFNSEDVPELIAPEEDRSRAKHWNGQFTDPEAFRESWKPRPGPLELVYNLVQQKKELEGTVCEFKVLNLGGGLGDFTVDLARVGAFITQVDFSKNANLVTSKRTEECKVSSQVETITASNLAALDEFDRKKEKFDMVFIYGGLSDNMPHIADIAVNLQAATKVMQPGGHLWYVGLEQPFLKGTGDKTATDIVGEYPCKPDLIKELLTNEQGIHLVDEIRGQRPDRHPLISGGESEDHTHIIWRGLFARELDDGTLPETPEFNFKNAVGPNWDKIWNELTKNE